MAEGCGREYTPWCWHQRYCGEDECRQRVLRWQAAQRQCRRRSTDEGRTAHRLAEKARRESARLDAADHDGAEHDGAEHNGAEHDAAGPDAAGSDAAEPDVAEPDTAGPDAAEPDVAEPDAAEPDAVEPDAAECVWLDGAEPTRRGHAGPARLCDRPACFRRVLGLTPHAASYCGPVCRRAVKRVVDREQKWLIRGALRGDAVCVRELERRRQARCQRREDSSRALREAHRREDREP